MSAPYFCIVDGMRCKKPHAELSTAFAEAKRLHELHAGEKTVRVLEVIGSIDAINPLKKKPGKTIEAVGQRIT